MISYVKLTLCKRVLLCLSVHVYGLNGLFFNGEASYMSLRGYPIFGEFLCQNYVVGHCQ